MKQIIMIILTVFMMYSCKNISNNSNENKTKNPVSKKSTIDSVKQTIAQLDNKELADTSEIMDAYIKAIQEFPNDSASLHEFYFEWNSTNDPSKINSQIKRLEELTSNESIEKYRNIENYLKPLLVEIVNSNTMSKSQSDSLVTLYSDYDYFSGESLFSRLLTEEENYSLVWESFKIMAKESSKDTCFISGLINLNNNIRTNVELAEAMEDFKVKAIENNPYGFLEMYNQRKGKQRNNFANNITVWDDPKKELMDLFSEISQNSTDENYRKLATELINNFKVE